MLPIASSSGILEAAFLSVVAFDPSTALSDGDAPSLLCPRNRLLCWLNRECDIGRCAARLSTVYRRKAAPICVASAASRSPLCGKFQSTTRRISSKLDSNIYFCFRPHFGIQRKLRHCSFKSQLVSICCRAALSGLVFRAANYTYVLRSLLFLLQYQCETSYDILIH